MKRLLITLVSLMFSSAREPTFELEEIDSATPAADPNLKLPADDPRYGLQRQCDTEVCEKAAEKIHRFISPDRKGPYMWFQYDVCFTSGQKEPAALNLVPCPAEPPFFLLVTGPDS